MPLAHDVVGPPEGRTAVILHGILGSKNNWRSFAHRLADASPGWRVVCCDVRNHGESHGQAAPHTIEACADDVSATVASIDVVIGHSFSGKVALELARRHSVRVAVSLDCPPGPRTFAGTDIERVLEAVGTVTMPVESRRDLVEALRARGLPDALAQWMTTNLRYVDGAGFTWRFYLPAIPAMLASFGALDLWPVVEEPAGVKVVLVRGGRSDRFTVGDLARFASAVARGAVTAHVLPSAGHWLHTDDPEGLLTLMAPLLWPRA
jgi:pimeloyl-ACP methyl ester carboxylesterase